MAKTSVLEVTPELEEKYWGGLQTPERFVIPRIRIKVVILSRKKVEGLTGRSYLPACSTVWRGFTSQQKQDWKDIDPHPQKHGWRTFVADKCKRIKFGLPGEATPNEFHQDMVGKLLIEAPAEEIKLIQPHPNFYWVNRKVTGKKGMYEPVKVDEAFALPLKITISYKSDLTSTGGGSFARFYATIRHLYQAQNLSHDEIIEIPLVASWTKQEATVTSLLGVAISYNLYIHLYKVRGTLLIDNVKAEHSASNWARDTYCKKIEQDFTRGFYQIPKHWAPITLPDGAGYKSIYPE